MNKKQILEEYKKSGYNAQNLMKVLDKELGGSKTSSFDGSLQVYQFGGLVVMVSTDGVEFFKTEE